MKPYYNSAHGRIYQGNALDVMFQEMPPKSVNTVIASPPYWGLRDYGVDGQIGLEKTPEEYVEKIVEIFQEIKRVLRDDGTVWLNLGDSYSGSGGWAGCKEGVSLSTTNMKAKANDVSIKSLDTGLKPKDLVGIPWRVAFALQADGWYLRQDIVWHKPNPMPESVTDRCTKAHEYLFLLSKNQKYYYGADAIKEDAKEIAKYNVRPNSNPNTIDRGYEADGKTYEKVNKRSVWTISTQPFHGAHFAVFPEKLVEPCVLAGCPEGGVVLDPFFGSGTTGLVAYKCKRKFIGVDLNPEYCEIAKQRIIKHTLQMRLW